MPLLALTMLALLVAAAPAARAQDTATVARAAWLAGCWEAASPRRTVEEHWMAPRGGAMVGMSRVVRDGRVADYELLVLREDGGRLVLRAHPSNQPSADFPQLTLGDSAAVFEDPAHDFPQRIGYRRAGPDSLVAWIEGTVRGQERRVDFRYRRVPCPSD